MRTGTMTSVGTGLAASVIAHLILLIAVAVPHQRQTAHGETVTVELVSADEAAPAFNDSPSQAQQPEQQPDWSQLQTKPPAQNAETSRQAGAQPLNPAGQRAPANQQQPQVEPQPQVRPQQPPPQPEPQPEQQAAVQPEPEQAEAPTAEPPAESLAEQGMRLAALLALPPPGQGTASASDVAADIKSSDMAAFKAHLKKCWKVPPGYSDRQKIKVVVRVMLRKDGKLAKDPEALEVTPASLAFPSFTSAITALKQCQPYTMLPAEKYKEWRVLDLNVSPDQMAGG